MTDAEDRLRARLRALRADFDQSFALPRAGGGAKGERLLAIRIGTDPYALRLSHVAVFGADRPITPVPSACPELLGVAGLRGAMVAVYDLASLLGLERADAPRWIARCTGSWMAFAFNAFDGQADALPDELALPAASTRSGVGEIVHIVGAARPVIDLPSLTRRLEELAQVG